ncbi:MAG: O-antigen ligase family protein [Lachnospiraceae bacterium]|nr:O-antigen ligase family protein [Lachnospiraceae bacterium]
MSTKKNHTQRSLLTLPASIYLFITLTIYPFFMLNGYFNAIYAKGIFQIYSILITDVIAILFLIIEHKKKEKTNSGSFPLLDYSILGFAITAVISGLLSPFGSNAFSGAQSWYMAAFELVLYASIYALLSKHLPSEIGLLTISYVVFAIVFLIAVLQGFQLDLFQLKSALSSDQWTSHISTVGNTNIYAGFLSLVLPFLMHQYITSKHSHHRILLGFDLILGFISLVVASSDAGYLGVGVGCLIILGYYLYHGKHFEEIQRLFQAVFMISVAILIIDFAYTFMDNQCISLSGISKLMQTYHLEFLPISLCVFFYFLSKAKIQFSLRKIFYSYIGIIIITATIALIYNVINFSFSWGTKRGYIWFVAMDLWKNFSIKEKLLGVGPDCFGLAIEQHTQYLTYINEHWNVSIANAHNEWLQYLCTMGLVGLFFYIGIIIGTIKTFINRQSSSLLCLSFFVGCMGYFSQGFFTNPNPFTATYLVIALACLRYTSK